MFHTCVSSGYLSEVFRCYAGRLNARGKETVRHSSVSAVSDHSLSASSSHQEPFKIAIIGAGFAGVAAAWHVMNVISEDGDADSRVINSRPVQLHLYDEKGIAGGASGVAAGLLHPYTPRGKIIWRGTEGVAATIRLVNAAEAAEIALDSGEQAPLPCEATRPEVSRRGKSLARRKGAVRLARTLKQARDLGAFGPVSAEMGGQGVCLNAEATRELLPGISVPAEVEYDKNIRCDYVRPRTRVSRGKTNHSGGRREAMMCERQTSSAAALYIPECIVLDTTRYLSALWDATRLLARSSSVPKGTAAHFRKRTFTSLRNDEDLQDCDAIIVACGAAAGSISELSEAGELPYQLQGGHVVELVPSDDTSGLKAWGDDMPGILGSPYIAPLGPERLLVGTTKEHDVSIADARSAGAVSAAEKGQRAQAALRAATKLMDASAAIFPPLSSMRVDITRYGVRANPPRRREGSLPLVGRIKEKGERMSPRTRNRTSARNCSPTYWFVGGLGARGLVYHGILGELVARAALTNEPEIIPDELRFDPEYGGVSIE